MSAVCVAREAELKKLRQFLDTAISGNFQVCFVIGEAGSGKTTLINAFVETVEKEIPQTIIAIGECNSRIGISDPYLPFKEVLAMLTGDADAKLAQGRVSQRTLRNLGKLVSISIETILELGPDLIGTILPGGALIARGLKVFGDKSEVMKKIKSRLDTKNTTELNQSAIFQQYSNVLSLLSQKQPLLIILDDLHWADSASVALLFHLSRKLTSSRIMIVGTYRPDEIHTLPDGSRHPMGPVTNELKRYFGDIWIDLGTQSEDQSLNFVSLIVDIEPNQLNNKFRQKLNSLTEGNALFTTELLRNLREKGDLVLDSANKWVEGPDLNWQEIPARVEGVIEERIARLEKELRDALSIASVEGESFTAQVISRLQELNERYVLHRLTDELEKQHRLVTESGEAKIGANFLSFYRFGHSLIHQYLYNELGHSERRILHKQVAQTLELLYQNQLDTIFLQLARHYEEAGEIEKASIYLIESANLALRISAFKEAKASLNKALYLGVPDVKLLITLHYQLGNVCYGLGEYDLARTYFVKSRDLAYSVNDKLHQALSENGIGRALADSSGPLLEAQRSFEAALQLANDIGDLDVKIRSLSQLGMILAGQGNIDEARGLLEESIELARKNNRPEFALSLYDLANLYIVTSDLNKAKELSIESIEWAKSRGNREIEAYSWNNLGYVQYELQDYIGATTSLQKGLVMGREIDSKWTIGEALNGLSFLACEMKDYASARNQLKDALKIFSTEKILPALLLVLIGFANLKFREGDFDEALELIGLAVSHEGGHSDIKHYAELVMKLVDVKKSVTEEEIARLMKSGAGMNLDIIVQTLLK